MLIKITSPEKIGWFHLTSKRHSVNLRHFKDLPPKFVIGPDIVSSLVRLDGITTFVKSGEVFMYIGKKKMCSDTGKAKTFRLIFAKNRVGYIDGKDVRHLEPADSNNFDLLESEEF